MHFDEEKTSVSFLLCLLLFFGKYLRFLAFDKYFQFLFSFFCVNHFLPCHVRKDTAELWPWNFLSGFKRRNCSLEKVCVWSRQNGVCLDDSDFLAEIVTFSLDLPSNEICPKNSGFLMHAHFHSELELFSVYAHLRAAHLRKILSTVDWHD